MPNHQIKRYTQDTSCAVCHRPVSRLRAQCDNCHRLVCRSHRPLFTSYWQCPDCIARIQSFTPAVPTEALYPTNPVENQVVTSQKDFIGQLKLAQSLMATNQEKADYIIEQSLIELFTDND